MPELRIQNLRSLWLSAFVLGLDQLSKYFAVSYLSLYQPHSVLSFFNLTLAYNRGAAFSFLSGAAGWQTLFLSIVAIAVSLFILFWLLRLTAHEKAQGIALSLIMGGAIGNLTDRIRLGHVIDFFDLYYRTWHFPVFNIADVAITFGAIILAYQVFMQTKQET